MKPDPEATAPEPEAVAGSAQPPRRTGPRRAGAVALHLAGLAALVLLYLGAASLMALAAVRVGADLLAGIDPFLPPSRRPFVGAVALARRELAVDILRQVFLAGLLLATAAWWGGTGWRSRLALDRAEPNGMRARDLLLVLLLWPVVHIAWVSLTADLFGASFGQGTRLSPLLTPGAVAAWLAYVVVLAPAAEELLMRGEVFCRARAVLGPLATILVTALLFCAVHVTGWGLARPVSLLPLALALGTLRWRTGRLWPCIALHGWSNLALIAYVLWPR
ncbi:CPBP family intramembrane glutamic endopeptidase [Methylobacterium dankookense]|uniref:CPBP family intramembrane glutamic endopeptidase n=1 Tax=Methylobacterium dankookense TaxID=560405 RepID=UPI003570AB76